MSELVNTLAQHTIDHDTHSFDHFNLQQLIADDGFSLRWLWLHARGSNDAHCLPAINQDKLITPQRSQFNLTDPTLHWTMGYGNSSSNGCDMPFCPKMTIIGFNVRSLQGGWT